MYHVDTGDNYHQTVRVLHASAIIFIGMLIRLDMVCWNIRILRREKFTYTNGMIFLYMHGELCNIII